MRIWWQSSMGLHTDPLWKPYEESLERHIKKVARPDTVVDIHGVAHMVPLVAGSPYVNYLNDGEFINNAIRAEREGYDAFCAGCTADPGIFQIKDATNFPVAFLFESSLHLACTLTEKFSLLAANKWLLLQKMEQLKRYDFESRYIPCDTFDVGLEGLPEGFKDPGPVIDAVKKAARKAIDEGAGILIPTCNCLNMVLVDCGYMEIDGVPILDTCGAMVKITELMVDLKRIGISRSKTGLYSRLPKEELANVRKIYGLE